MKKCPYCAEEIQDAAVVCKHCGRDFAVPPPAALAVPTTPKKQHRALTLLFYAFVGFCGLGLISILAGGGSTSSTSSQKKTLEVTIGWNDFALQVTNVSAPSGGEMIVYINGTPPFTYRADTNVPEPGQSVRLPLREFVKKNGERFNPMTQAVTVAWVGGGGYDYQSFKK